MEKKRKKAFPTMPLNLRVPTPLRDAIEHIAEKTKRSLSDVAVEALQEKFMPEVAAK